MMAKRIFGCLGKASFWNAEGYSKSFGSYVGFSFGQAAGGSNNALNDLVQGPREENCLTKLRGQSIFGTISIYFDDGISWKCTRVNPATVQKGGLSHLRSPRGRAESCHGNLGYELWAMDGYL
jgi:hypothetical protein